MSSKNERRVHVKIEFDRFKVYLTMTWSYVYAEMVVVVFVFNVPYGDGVMARRGSNLQPLVYKPSS